MDLDREALIKEAHQTQRIIVAAVFQQVALPILLELDLSMAQLKGIVILATSKNCTVSQVAEQLQIGRSAASLLMDRMVVDGLVERREDPEDRRRTLLGLSQRGEELVTRLRQGRAERNPLPAWLANVNDHDLQALVQGLRALAKEASAATGTADLRSEEET